MESVLSQDVVLIFFEKTDWNDLQKTPVLIGPLVYCDLYLTVFGKILTYMEIFFHFGKHIYPCWKCGNAIRNASVLTAFPFFC